MPNLALCTYALPGGRTCRQPRLRNESHCRFHVRNHAAAEFQARMSQLNDELEALDTPQLLEALRDKLDHVYCVLRCYPEARLALTIAIDRLHRLTPMPAMTAPQLQQPQSRAPIPNEINELLETLMSAMTSTR